jgi:sugar lactone lactonase YvrE
VAGWEQLPAGARHRDVAGVAVDRADRVYLITRGDARVLVYEPDGTFVRSWGEGLFTDRTHGITVGPDGSVFCVDDAGHDVRQYTADGVLGMRLGTGRPSDTGYDGTGLASIKGGPPFNRPTNVAVSRAGELFVADGYGNARIHVFSPNGRLLGSWGEPGIGPGQFMLPHGIAILADGRVLVADRENDRIQVFTQWGEYVEEWNVQRPTDIAEGGDGLIYVADLWWRVGQTSPRHGRIVEERFGQVTVLDQRGGVVGGWGGTPPGTPSGFTAPHGIAVDSRGDVYVAEVSWTFGVRIGDVPVDVPTIRKFTRR